MTTLPCSRGFRSWVTALSACFLLEVAGCTRDAVAQNPSQIAKAESTLDAFYSWDADLLLSHLTSAEGSGGMLYYQKWAEAAHYEIEERRPCTQLSASSVQCAVTVTDDFGSTLGYTATDTFTFGFANGGVSRVEFEGDDPAIFSALFAWMTVYRADVFENECQDMFSTGTTPAECARAVADAAQAFVAWSPIH